MPKYIDNPPTGVKIRGNSILIRFTYKHIRCEETLKGKNVTQSNVAYAGNKVAAIKHQIADGTFDYSEHFPDSSKLERFTSIKGFNRTIEEGLVSWLERKKNRIAPTSFKSYRNKALKHILPRWKDYPIRDIKKTELERWQLVELPHKGLADKTINTVFIVMRGIFKDAMGDQIIKMDPISLIENLKKPEPNTPDPFTNKEMLSLLSIKTGKLQELNAYGFNSWTGLRVSELLGLAWEDIDTKKWTIKICRGRVDGEYKIPKTASSIREIDLQDEAIFWLKKQLPYTSMLQPESIEVRQKNHRTFKAESLRFVFNNTATNRPWSGDGVYREVFATILRKAGLRYRGPNQLRHTFASRLLTLYIPPEWIAPIMGTSIEMLRNHYATFIPEDRPNIGRLISNTLRTQEQELQKIA